MTFLSHSLIFRFSLYLSLLLTIWLSHSTWQSRIAPRFLSTYMYSPGPTGAKHSTVDKLIAIFIKLSPFSRSLCACVCVGCCLCLSSQNIFDPICNNNTTNRTTCGASPRSFVVQSVVNACMQSQGWFKWDKGNTWAQGFYYNKTDTYTLVWITGETA